MRSNAIVPLLVLALASLAFPAAARTPGELPALYSSLDDAALNAAIAPRLAGAAPAGADRSLLFERLAMELTVNGLAMRFDGAVILHAGAAGGLERRVPLPFEGELGATGAWIRHADGTVTRLGEPAREEAPLSGSPVLVVSAPDARAGDVVGWSAAVSIDGLNMRVLHPTRDLFVHESEIRMIVPPAVHYGLAILNGTAGDAVIAVGTEFGKAFDQAAVFTDLPADAEGPFATPTVLQPALLVTAMGQYAEPMQRWFMMDSWLPLAGYVAGIQRAFTENAPVSASVAKQAVRDDDTDRVKILKLQRLLARQIATIPPGDFAAPSELSDDALERKAATSRQKAMMLLTMASSLGLDVDLVLARDTRLGPLDDAMPSLAQFTDTLVRLNGAEPLYLTDDDRYPAGTLPHHLWGATAVAAAEGAAETVQKVMMKAMMAGATPEWGDAQPLERLVLPGDPDAPMGTVTEALAWDAQGAGEARLESLGDTPVFQAYRARTAAQTLLNDALAQGYPDLGLTAASAAAGKPKTSTEELHVIVKGPVSGQAGVPAAEGGTWVLPAAAVFGAPTAAAWREGGPFHVDGPQVLTRTWSHPLPDGWSGVKPVTTPRVTNDVLDYRAQVSAADGVLTVTRTVTFRPQHRMAKDAAVVAGALERVRAFESAPLTVEKQ